MKRSIEIFDRRLTILAKRLGSKARAPFLFITNLGDPYTTIGIGIVIAIVGLFIADMEVFFAGLSVPATLLVGYMLKRLFARARPLTEYAANIRIDTFSFPSGHTSGATIAYAVLGYFATVLLLPPLAFFVVVVAVGIIVGVGVSRVYLGAHFPSDVTAGWLLGAIAFMCVLTLLSPLQ